MNFYPPFLTNRDKCSIDDIVKHIEHFMELGGGDNIGIGADFDGVDCLPERYKAVLKICIKYLTDCLQEDILKNKQRK